MYKLNLKTNPELARQRHNEQNRAWYRRNKEKVMEMQRKRRKKLKETGLYGEIRILRYTSEIHQMPRHEYTKQLLKHDTLRNVRNDEKDL